MREKQKIQKVLYVEDHFPDARLVKELMVDVEVNPFQIEHVDTVYKAMQRLSQEEYQVILLDMSLPDGSGISMIQRVISANPGVPVVVFTGTDDKEVALDALGVGAQDYLVKGSVNGELLVRSLNYAVERAQSERRMRYLATHDTLTELPNRTLFFDRMKQAINRAVRQGLHFALILLDLDGFKEINDRMGHQQGDEVLKIAAQRMKGSLRASDTIARWGGDEFAVVVEGNPSRDESLVVAERLRRSLTGTILLLEEEWELRASFGISRFPEHGSTIDELIKHADEAMYHAKEHTLGIFCFGNG
jgi:diguanylate cyclase (GGDEF)-like protein